MLKSLWRIVIGKPCEGKLHARFDEGLLETYPKRNGAPATYSVIERTTKFGFLFIFLSCVMPILFAGDQLTSGQVLTLGLGARPMGMGGAFYGLSNDLNAVQWNPAGLGSLRSYALDTHYSSLIEGLSYGGLTFALPGPFKSDLGLSYFVFDSGAISRNVATDRGLLLSEDGSFAVKDTIFIATLANGYYDPWYFGVNIKSLNEKIDSASDSTLLFDVGVLAKLMPQLRIGVGAQNLGGSIQFIDEEEKLPNGYAAGVAFRPLVQKNFFITADGKKVTGQKNGYAFGGEYVFSRERVTNVTSQDVFTRRVMPEEIIHEDVPLLALRMGLRPTEAHELGDSALVTFGIGIYIASTRLDYAFVGAGDLGVTHRVSLSFSFGKTPRMEISDWNRDDEDVEDSDRRSKEPAKGKRTPDGRYQLN